MRFMARFKPLLSLCAVLFAIFSCTSPETPEPTPPIPETPTIEVITSDVTLPEAGTASLRASFKTNSAWTVETSDTKITPTWFDVSPKSGGAGVAALTVTLKEANQDYSDRSGYIRIKCGSLFKNITVIQKKREAILLTKDRYQIDSDGGKFSVEVKSNVSFLITIPNESSSWIARATASKALTTNNIGFIVSKNSSEENREGIVVFSSGSLRDTVYVYQTPRNSLILTTRNKNIDESSQNFDVELRTNVDYDINFLDGTWLTQVQSKANRVDRITLTARENTTYNNRTMRVVFKDRNSSTADTLTVTQAQKNALIISQKTFTLSRAGGIIDLELRANVIYDIIMPKNATWLTRIQTKGLNTYFHQFSVSQYNGTENRQAQVIFKDRNSIIADTLTVIQGSQMPTERDILMEFYNSTGGDQWKNRTNWGTDAPLKEWYGVRMGLAGKIIELRLIDNNLSGRIPQSIGGLENLISLVLVNNKLIGVIPAAIGKLTNLKSLYLYDNQLTGNVSANFVSLLDKQDAVFDVSYNNLSGTLPKSITGHKNWTKHIFNIIRQNQGYGFDLSGMTIKSPDFEMLDIDGENQSSKAIFAQSQLTVLYKWATWCPYSKQYAPKLVKMHKDYKSKGLSVVGFVTSDSENIPEYIKSNNIEWSNILDRDRWFSNFLNCDFVPAVVVVDNRGEIVWDIDQNRDDLEVFLRKTLGDPSVPDDLYSSKDYSEDGKILTLQRATRGSGINIVIMGDGFVDRDMAANGKYEKVMNDAMRHFFSVEPSKSYREYFNVYAVKVVSRNEVYDNPHASTALEVKFGEGVNIEGNDDICKKYAESIFGVKVTNSIVHIVANSPRYAGVTRIYDNGAAFAYTPITNYDDTEFAAVIHHEVLGHGFIRLLDEYMYYDKYITDQYVADFNKDRLMYNMGWNMTLNENDLPWQHFIGHPKYSMVGLYEGGYFFTKGVWRAEKNHCMNNNVPYFNGPSRELFVKRLKQLSGESYSWDEFVVKDRYEPMPLTKALSDTYKRPPLAPPVLIK